MFNFASPESDAKVAAPEPEPKAGTAMPDLRVLLRRVLGRLPLVAACGIAAVVAAVLMLPMITPVYTAGIQILIDPADLRVIDNGVTPTSPNGENGVSIAESQVRVVGSDSVLKRVVTRLDLGNDPEFAGPLPSANSTSEFIKRLLGFTPASELPQDPELRALEALRKRLVVRRPERTFVIEAVVRSERGDKAARIANTIADVYFAEEAAARANSAGRASDALASRLTELRAAVQAAEDRLAKYREEKGLVATNGRLLVDQRLGELNQQLTAASIRTAEARARADQARQLRGAGSGSALPELLQSPELRALRQQHTDLARQIAETSTRLGPRHPVVVEQIAQIRELERAMAREKSRIIDSTVKELDRAIASENAIRQEIERLKTETATNDRSLIGLRELERELETQRAIYESFLKRARETGQQERLDTTNMRVISPATPPLARSWPPSPKMVIPVALLLGLLAGAGLAILRPTRKEKVQFGPLVLASSIPAKSGG